MKKTLFSFLFLTVSLTAAPLLVTIDTAALNTQTGTLTVQFGPAIFFSPYESGTATVDAFSLGGGSFNSVAFGPNGGASGSLPGPLVIINSDFFNGIVYNTTFGATASFQVEFAGNALTIPGQTNVSTFTVTLNGTTSIAAVADLFGDGVVDNSFSSPGVTWQPATEPIPEPSSAALLALGLAAGAWVLRRR